MYPVIEVRPFTALSEEEQHLVGELEGGESTVDPRFAGYLWAKADWQVVLRVGGEIVSGAKIVDRVIGVGGLEVRVGGIGDVATARTWRRQGLATAAMRRVGDFLCNDLGADFGLLFCDTHLLPFYGRLGWQRVDGPTMIEVPWGRVPFPEETMVLPCRGVLWPGGETDLRGLPW